MCCNQRTSSLVLFCVMLTNRYESKTKQSVTCLIIILSILNPYKSWLNTKNVNVSIFICTKSFFIWVDIIIVSLNDRNNYLILHLRWHNNNFEFKITQQAKQTRCMHWVRFSFSRHASNGNRSGSKTKMFKLFFE